MCVCVCFFLHVDCLPASQTAQNVHPDALSIHQVQRDVALGHVASVQQQKKQKQQQRRRRRVLAFQKGQKIIQGLSHQQRPAHRIIVNRANQNPQAERRVNRKVPQQRVGAALALDRIQIHILKQRRHQQNQADHVAQPQQKPQPRLSAQNRPQQRRRQQQ